MKKLSVFILLFLMVTTILSASDIRIGNLEDAATQIQDFFTSPVMNAVFAISLCGIAVGLIINRSNEEAKKKLIIWGVAIAIIFGSKEIVNLFWTESAVMPGVLF